MWKKYVIGLSAVILFFGYTIDGFITPGNLVNIVRQFSVLGLMAAGGGIVLIGGGVDLSVGAQLALDGMIMAMLIVKQGFPVGLAVLATLFFGAFLGLINGGISAGLGIESPLATFGTMIIMDGVVYVISDGQSIFGLPESFQSLGTGYLWGIPISLLVLAAVSAGMLFLLNGTYFGRYLYAAGENAEASNFLGIHSQRMKIFAYTVCGILVSIAAMIALSYNNAAFPYAGGNYLNDCLVVWFFGGAVSGGRGKMEEILLFALFVVILDNGLQMFGINGAFLGGVKAVLLLLLLWYWYRMKDRKNR